MCIGLNFTKLNEKSKKLMSSIFARFGSQEAGNFQAAVSGAGAQGSTHAHVVPQGKKERK
ncbi:MAG: hypothetical protein Q3M24_02435 [Candidatus Electrothrix aestuarii]|jgi:hypothetical protein|uniref:Uncharacterized protein n=1 Tax=Candidatus Electrothrix aestuarii TaxID=3062594 RepID=A0AAU8LX01_9BACT|nr:hypothetical protein [Candidatus Electrothrix aestuarii]